MPTIQPNGPSNAAAVAPRNTFPVVAVGASAGGLAPTIELLRELGAEPGIAIVIIHHLDPTHESGLVEILSRATTMPVALATDGVRVEPNHVYVVPPNAGLLIGQDILKVVPRREEGGLHLPINRFFESLALDRDGLSIGVVLSGSGFDGTEGIKAIKREGGITMAQDATATFGSMPQNAIETGCVDLILAPAGLARELARMGADAPLLLAGSPKRTGELEYAQILAAMRKACGVDFASYKQPTLQRRLQRRLVLHGLPDLAAYAELLKRDPGEVGRLCEEVLIHVTGFFREPEAFDALRTLALPKLCAGRPHDAPIRVWVPGCSTGEEVYSIAICLLEFLEEAKKDISIKIFGTDLSLAVIEKARAARYPESIEGDVSPGRLQRFFSKDEAGYRIRPNVRDLCVFAKHDVSRDPPFSAMDLVSCRNLMIYLGPDLQDRVIGLLHYALKEPGYIVVGSSETVRAFTGFVAVDGKNKIYARSPGVSRLAFDFARRSLPGDSTRASATAAAFPDGLSVARSLGSGDVHREADRLVLAEFAPPGVVVTDDLAVVQFRGQTGPFLEPVPGVASLDLLRLAREELRLPLRRAIDRARAAHAPVLERCVALSVGERRRIITLEIIPFAVHSAQQRFFLVLFKDAALQQARTESSAVTVAEEVQVADSALRQELSSTRQYLESVIEQLEAANEELKAANEETVSSNEELRSTNEELQSAKEELQATNEELRTVNDELRDRNVEATRLSDDLANVLNSVEIPILIAGRDLRLRRFTPAAATVFHLAAGDLGRPLPEVSHVIAVAPALLALLPDVLEHLAPGECTIQDAAGAWYNLSVRPYLTGDGRIDGTVVSARNVDAETRAARAMAAAEAFAHSIVDTVRHGLVVLDRELRVNLANDAFREIFHLAAGAIVGRRLEDLGRGPLALPAFQKFLEDRREGAFAENLRFEHDDVANGPRAFRVNARRIEGSELLLVALEDVTEHEHAQQLVEHGLSDALTGALEGVLMVGAKGRMVFVNSAAAAMFGYGPDELTGQPVEVVLPGSVLETLERRRLGRTAPPSSHSLLPESHFVGRRRDGSGVPIEVAFSTMMRDGGPVAVAFITDITERRAAEQEIRAYQGRLQRMAFDAALTEDRERRRIAIELHDQVGQALALAQIELSSARRDVTGLPRAAIDRAVALIEQTITTQRDLIFELSPPLLYDLGVAAALEWLAEDVQKHHGIKIVVGDDGAAKLLDDAAKAVVFRCVRELVMNVLKHAKTQTATVSLRRNGTLLVVEVEDRGTGFDPNALPDSARSFGLLSVREQITSLGGTLSLESAVEQGTVVRMCVPLQPSDAPPSLSENDASPVVG